MEHKFYAKCHYRMKKISSSMQNATIGWKKRSYNYGTIKLKKETCMKLEFMELISMQNATIGWKKNAAIGMELKLHELEFHASFFFFFFKFHLV